MMMLMMVLAVMLQFADNVEYFVYTKAKKQIFHIHEIYMPQAGKLTSVLCRRVHEYAHF